jgi:CheY-like chemotaxis protein
MSMTRICILQVEDDENDIFFLKRAFKDAGINNPVQAVSDGQMAIDYLAGTGEFADRERYPLPGLVLLDLRVPKRNGLEVLAWLRSQPQFRSLVVIVFSTSALPSDIALAYGLGANSYIEKPMDVHGRRDFVHFLKGWWIGYNKFAPVFEVGEAIDPAREEGQGTAGAAAA